MFMIIGIDASRANRKHKSGVEWYAYYLIKYFAQIDKKNTYILYSDRPLEGGLGDLTKISLNFNEYSEPKFKNGNQIIKSPYNNFRVKILHWPFVYFWTLGRLSLEMLFNKPDVLFMPNSGIPFFSPKKTINTIHDVAFKREASVYERKDLGPQKGASRKIINCLIRILTFKKQGANTADYLDWTTAYALKKAKKIITVSEFTKKEIIELYDPKKEKIEMVHNGFNNMLYKKIEDKNKIVEVLNKYGLEGPYLLYVGRLEKKKNIKLLAEAFTQAKNLNKNMQEKLVLVGDAGFGFDEINHSITALGMEREIIMPGWILEEDMPYIFNGATAFIFPSRHEGFGIPILQSLNCGVPVAVSDIPAFREIAGSSVLFFNHKDKKSIAQAIIKIISDNELRKKLIENGFKTADNFSWEKCARETLRMIESF